MGYSVIPVTRFKKEAKRLIRKYPSLRAELAQISTTLADNPTSGKSLGDNVYKIRLGIKSKGKGKSGGARVITYVITENKEIYLLSIYDKSELDTIDDKILKALIADLQSEE